MLKTHDFYYDLPEELIAQTPLERRDASRLMTLDRKTGEVTHRHFYDLLELLQPGDCLVMNNSRVLPARLLGHRVPTGGAVEVLLLRDLGDGKWECLTRPGRKTRPGTALSFGDGELTATVVDAIADGNKIVQFHYDGIFLEVLERLGKMPLPPYIKAELQDQERYQTVYSRELGSAAAPTAGLHFTKELLQRIADMGVKIGYVTLHVGLGTFRPVKEDEIELYKIVDKTMKRSLGQRMVGCGTIVVTSRDCDTPNKELKSVKKPREVKKILDEAVKLERDKYMVRGRDMVGANLHGHGDMGEDNLHSEDFDEMADM